MNSFQKFVQVVLISFNKYFSTQLILFSKYYQYSYLFSNKENQGKICSKNFNLEFLLVIFSIFQ